MDLFRVSLNKAGLTTAQAIQKIAAHAVVGGVSSTLNGGKFGHGFVSAGITQSMSGAIDNIGSSGGRIIAAAAVGGTASSITGGKFANGALTGAFLRTFNHELHSGLIEVEVYTQGGPNCWGSVQGLEGISNFFADYSRTTGANFNLAAPQDSMSIFLENISGSGDSRFSVLNMGSVKNGSFRVDLMTNTKGYHVIFEGRYNGQYVVYSKDGLNPTTLHRSFEDAWRFHGSEGVSGRIDLLDMELNSHLNALGNTQKINQALAKIGKYDYVNSFGFRR